MKLSIRRTIEILLVLIIIVALFLPYIYNITPFNYAFSEKPTVISILVISLPIGLIGVFLSLLFFQGILSNPFLKFVKIVSFLMYMMVFGCYVYLLYKEFDHGFEYYTGTLLASLLLLLPNLIFNKHSTDNLLSTVLATISLPFVFHLFLSDYDKLQYGGMIIQAAFILLYLIGFSKVFRPSK